MAFEKELSEGCALSYNAAMRETKTYYVYIMTNKSRTLYVGMTNDLERRVWEHKTKAIPEFTAKYNITQVV